MCPVSTEFYWLPEEKTLRKYELWNVLVFYIWLIKKIGDHLLTSWLSIALNHAFFFWYRNGPLVFLRLAPPRQQSAQNGMNRHFVFPQFVLKSSNAISFKRNPAGLKSSWVMRNYINPPLSAVVHAYFGGSAVCTSSSRLKCQCLCMRRLTEPSLWAKGQLVVYTGLFLSLRGVRFTDALVLTDVLDSQDAYLGKKGRCQRIICYPNWLVEKWRYSLPDMLPQNLPYKAISAHLSPI